MSDKGFIKLSRKFFSNELWKEAREFSECEAWLDLLQSARFEATDKAYSELIGGREISYTRGQYPASISFLMKRWQWSEKKVRYFLGKLKKRGMITTCGKQGMNVITICKYDEYNPIKGEDKGIDNINEINELKDALGKLRTDVIGEIEKLGQAGGNKKKKEEDNTKKSPKGDKESVIPPEILEKSLEDCYEELSTNSSWIETVVMNKRSAGHPHLTLDSFQEYLKRFFDKLQNEGETRKSPKDGMAHFVRWLDIELGKSKQISTRQKMSSYYSLQKVVMADITNFCLISRNKRHIVFQTCDYLARKNPCCYVTNTETKCLKAHCVQ